MTLALAILKWLLVAAAVVYLGGLAVLYLKQRELLFPAPPVGRTARPPPVFPTRRSMS